MRMRRGTILSWLFIGCLFTQASKAAEISNTNAIKWGTVQEGLQLGVTSDETAGVVHCWLRNGVDHAVTWNDYFLGNWGAVQVLVQAGGSWQKLERIPSSQRLYRGDGPSKKDLRQLIPGEIAVWKRPSGVLSERRLRSPSTRTNQSLALDLGWNWVSAIPDPSPKGATFVVDLLDFAWPSGLFTNALLELQVVQQLVPAADDYNRKESQNVLELASPVFVITARALDRLLETVGRDGFFEKQSMAK